MKTMPPSSSTRISFCKIACVVDPQRLEFALPCGGGPPARQSLTVFNPHPFPLDYRTAGSLIGVAKSTASDYFQRLVSDKVVSLVRKGNWKDGIASEWRYLGPLEE